MNSSSVGGSGAISPNFSFVASINRDFATLLSVAEGHYHHDPASCLVKLRKFIEALAKEVLSRHAQNRFTELTLGEMEDVIRERQLLPSHLIEAFTQVRQHGNDAAHHGIIKTHDDAAGRLRDAFWLVCWYYKSFGGEEEIPPKYVLPEVPGATFDIPETWTEAEALRERFAARPAVSAAIRDWLVREAQGAALLLTGPPGQGKSALIAQLAGELGAGEQGIGLGSGNWLCVLHMGKSSGDPRRILQFWILQLLNHLELRVSYEFFGGTTERLRNRLVTLCTKAVDRGHRVCLLLDAFDELSAEARQARFLPSHLPEGVRLIISCRPIKDHLARIRSRVGETTILELQSVDANDIRGFADLYLEPSRADRVETVLGWEELLARTRGNALLLRRAAENIRRLMTAEQEVSREQLIDVIPATLAEVFESIYLELTSREKGELTALTLQALAIGRDALSHEDLRHLLAARGSPLDSETIRQVLRTIEGYLLPHGAGRYRLFHAEFAKYILETILDRSSERRWHNIFIDWLEAPEKKAAVYRLEFLSYHLLALAECSVEKEQIAYYEYAAATLCDWTYIEDAVSAGLATSLRENLGELARLPLSASLLRKVQGFSRFITVNQFRLHGDRGLLVQYALDQEAEVVHQAVCDTQWKGPVLERIGTAVKDSPRLRTILPQPKVGQTALSFSPDGKRLAGLFEKGPTLIWGTNDWKLTHQLEIDGGVDMIWTEPNTLVIAESEGGLSEWDIGTETRSRRVGHGGPQLQGPRSVSPDHLGLFVVRNSNAIELWNLNVGRLRTLRSVEPDKLPLFDHACNGGVLATAVEEGIELTTKISEIMLEGLDESDKEKMKELIEGLREFIRDSTGEDGFQIGTFCASVEAVGQDWITMHGNTLGRYDLCGAPLGGLEIDEPWHADLFVGPRGHVLLVGSSVLVIDPEQLEILDEIPQARSRFTPSIGAISPDGSTVALATDTGATEIWDTDLAGRGSDPKHLTDFSAAEGSWAFVRFSPKWTSPMEIVVQSHSSAEITLELEQGAAFLRLVRMAGQPTVVARTPAGDIEFAPVSGNDEKTVIKAPARVYHPPVTPSEESTLWKGHGVGGREPGMVRGKVLDVSPDGTNALVLYEGRWEPLGVYRLKCTAPHETAVPVWESDNLYGLWSITDSGVVLNTYDRHSENEKSWWLRLFRSDTTKVEVRLPGEPSALLVSPGGDVATGHADGLVYLWDGETLAQKAVLGEPILSPVLRGAAIRQLSATSDDRYIAAVFGNGLLRIWDTASGDVRYTYEDRSGLFGCCFIDDETIAFGGASSSCHVMRLRETWTSNLGT